MSDVIAAALDHQSAEDAVVTAKESLADLRQAAEGSFRDLVSAAAASDDEQLRAAAEAVTYCDTEIANQIEGTDGERERKTKVVEAAKAMREAAKRGDARAAEADLAQAESDLADVRGTVRDLKKARKEAAAKLVKLAGAVA